MPITTEEVLNRARSLTESVLEESEPAQAARYYVQNVRLLLTELHREGASGSEVVSSYARLMDHLVCYLYEKASRDHSPHDSLANGKGALIAQGGYGRGELNPNSDVDLLFLYRWKVTPYLKAVTEEVLYPLWDSGLQVGHAIRSVKECVRLAGKDMKVKTSLLDTRYLCGDRDLFADFERAVESYLINKNGNRFVKEKLAESRLRHERYGGSVYLLEPDVKEGEGGLRDIHAALWIARVKKGVRDLDGFVAEGLLSEKELMELRKGRDFLWRIRNELHFSTGKHQDQITFEDQERVARALGYRDEDGVKGVEIFMRRYYLAASEISRLTSLIIHRVTELSGGAGGRTRFLGREIRKGVRVSRGVLWVSDPGILASDPATLVTIFSDLQKTGAAMDHASRELVREHLHLIDDGFRRSAAVQKTFLEILKWEDRVYETLLEMHRAGVLGALIPEFGRLLCMVLHDLNHIYTVDQHSLRAIMELERLKAGTFKNESPLLTQLARDVEQIEILYLGLLLHDIGKGQGGGHSEIGSQMVRKIARRMRLNVDATAQLEFLVHHHLLLTHTAFQRDIEDEKLILDFAQTAGSVSNLKMLYLLTYADVRAVGPEVWNNWKGSLLMDLYLSALEVLEGLEKGEYQREDRRSKIRRIQGRVRRRLSRSYDGETIQRFFHNMPDRYFLTTPEDDMPLHLDLTHRLRNENFLSSVRHVPEREYSEMTICAKDSPGLFARITGVFASMGLDIVSARISTRKDGLILDVFRISHGGKPEVVMDPGKWTRLRSTLDKVLAGEANVADLVEASKRPLLSKMRGPNVPTVVKIDNHASEDFTIVEVYTRDRIGVLFTITYALHRIGISIHLAKISTNVDQAADVFYVTGENGKKMKDPDRLSQIRRSLKEKLEPEHEERMAGIAG